MAIVHEGRCPGKFAGSLLDAFLGSAEVADKERAAIRQRRKNDAILAQKLALAGGANLPDLQDSRDAGLRKLEAEVRQLRASIPGKICRHTRRVMVAELPNAVRYLLTGDRAKWVANGKA